MKTIKRLLSLSIVVLAFLPGTSFALLPFIYGIGIALGGTEVFVNALFASAAVIGSVIVLVTFGLPPTASTPPFSAPLTVVLDQKYKLPAPSGWTLSNTRSMQPVPPANALARERWFPYDVNQFQVLQQAAATSGGFLTQENAALQACASSFNRVFLLSTQSPAGHPDKIEGKVKKTFQCVGLLDGSLTEVNIYGTGACPDGYGTEVATVIPGVTNCGMGVPFTTTPDPTIIKKPDDSKCTVIDSPTGWKKDPLDTDCVYASVLIQPNSIEVIDSGEANAGSRLLRGLAGQAAGEVAIVQDYRAPDGSLSHEQVNTRQTQVPCPDGDNSTPCYTSTIVSKTAGSGRGAGGDNATFAPGGGAGGGGSTGGGSGGTGTCGGPNQPACSTGGSAVCGAAPLPPCQIDLGGQATVPGDPDAVSSSDITSLLQLPSLDAFKTFAIPSHVSVCPTSSFTAFDKTYTFDAHCALLDAHTAALRGVMSLVFSISAIFITLRA